MARASHPTANAITFGNGITIELLRAQAGSPHHKPQAGSPHHNGGEFLGLGGIRVGKTLLRSGRRPMFAAIRTPDGITLLNYRLVKQRISREGAVLDFAMQQQAGGLMEWMVHSVRNRLNTADWTLPPRDAKGTKLRVAIRPVTRRLGSLEGVGFSYRYSYRSASLPIYKILDRGTWEIGGRAVGNEIWMRSCFSPPITALKSAQQFFSTEWYLPSISNPNIFQFLPLQTELQGFTFTASAEGVLVTWPTEASHVRTLIEKQRGTNEIVHLHEHCGDLSLEFTTPAVEVLWLPGKRDRVGLANLYECVKECVHDALHRDIGMRRERVSTYGMIEEWGNPDFKRYARLGLPKLLDAKLKVIGIANNFQNNMNTYGVSNMCCTVDLKIAESVGEENVRAFCRKAKAGGAAVEMWGNTSISTLSWILDQRHGKEQRIRFLPREGSVMAALAKAEAPFVRNPSNAIESDHYAPVFAVLNLRDPVVRKYWLDHWKHACDRVGLNGIFLDSSFNLSSDKFHWAADADPGRAHGATADQTHLLGHYRPRVEPPSAILSQYSAHLELMAAMQKIGYRYCNEDLGVFGIHRHGPGAVGRLSSLSIWSDCLCNFDVAELAKAGVDPDEVYFKALAYRMMWMLYWDIKSDRLSFHYSGVRGDDDLPKPQHLALLKVYNEVEPYLFHRTILPGERGVLYNQDGKQVLWAFEDFTHDLGGARNVLDVTENTLAHGTEIKARKRHVYLAG